MIIKEPKLLWLRSPESTTRLADYADSVDWESVLCPIHDGHQRAGKRLGDLRVELPGGVVPDFVWTFLNECLVQDRVLEVFHTNNVTGYEVKPVKAVFKRKTDRKPPRLWELVVTGWAGVAPPSSGIKVVERCEACGYTHYSNCTHPDILINSMQWDGSDLFIVWPMPGLLLITERVAGLLRDNSLKGFRLMSLDELKNMKDGFSPGRLCYHMPEYRARELGEPLGIF